MIFTKDPIQFLDQVSIEHKKRLNKRSKIRESLRYMGEAADQKGIGEEFMKIYIHNPSPLNPDPKDENTDLSLLQIYEHWKKEYNLKPVQPWDGTKLRPWLPDECNPKVPYILQDGLHGLLKAYSSVQGADDYSNYWSRIDALGHAIELYFSEIRLHKVWSAARTDLQEDGIYSTYQSNSNHSHSSTNATPHHSHAGDAKAFSKNDKKGAQATNTRLYTVTELYNIETAIYSVRFWGFLKWADNLRKKLFNLPIENTPDDPNSDINFLDRLGMIHFPWHDDVFGNGTCPSWNDQFGRKASHIHAWGTQGYGVEFFQFHKELVASFDSWLIDQGLNPIKEWLPNEHNTAYLLKYAFDGPWGLGGSNGDILPIELVAPDLADDKLHKFDSIADLATYIDDYHRGFHGVGHVQNADLRDPYCNNYSYRFFGWHKWIDSLFTKLLKLNKPLFIKTNASGAPIKDPLNYVLDTSKYDYGPAPIAPFSGSFVYQSLHHNENLSEADPDKILWFRAEMNLQQINGTELIGELDSGHPDYKYQIKGYIDQDNISIQTKPNWWDERLIVVMSASGNTPLTKGHLYEYRAFYEPKWPNGKDQKPTLIGTTLKSKRPDDPSQEGYVGSFYSVKRNIKRQILFDDYEIVLDYDRQNIKILAWGAGGGAGSDGPGEGGTNGKDGGDTFISIHHIDHKHTHTVAGGGRGGIHGVFQEGKGGLGGVANNGDRYSNGQNGEDASEKVSGKGGDAPENGGKGGTGVGTHLNGEHGFSPGGGGSGAQEGHSPAGGGGSGAYLEKFFKQLEKGTSISIKIGKGGLGGDGGFRRGGNGADGRVIITWE